MKPNHFLSVIFLSFIPVLLYAQDKSYSDNIKDGDKYYYSKQYQLSADAYSKAFAAAAGQEKIEDQYNAACSWTLAGNKDSAFYLLNRISGNAQFDNYNHLMIDPDLSSLHRDARWGSVCAMVKAHRNYRDSVNIKDAHLDGPLVDILDTVYQNDQDLRSQAEELGKEYTPASKEMRDLWKSIAKYDSIDLIKVEHILDTRGWLGADVVGTDGNITLFLVIQHSNLKTQEKYMPMMRQAVADKKANPSAFALLEDRVALGEGKMQVYGSQISEDSSGNYWVSPLEDPDNVDKRRAQMNLQPLADYLKYWNIKWDVEAYKKQLPDLIAKAKKN